MISRLSVALLLVAGSLLAQEPAVGKILIATRKTQDRDFGQSVILLIHYGDDGALGLMINRPLEVPINKLFPDLKQAQGSAYLGGPIALGARGLLRSRTKPKQGESILSNVYVISDLKTLRELITANMPSKIFRVYGGCAGWTVGQLTTEIAGGLWNVSTTDATTIFDPNPKSLWPRLISGR